MALVLTLIPFTLSLFSAEPASSQFLRRPYDFKPFPGTLEELTVGSGEAVQLRNQCLLYSVVGACSELISRQSEPGFVVRRVVAAALYKRGDILAGRGEYDAALHDYELAAKRWQFPDLKQKIGELKARNNTKVAVEPSPENLPEQQVFSRVDDVSTGWTTTTEKVIHQTILPPPASTMSQMARSDRPPVSHIGESEHELNAASPTTIGSSNEASDQTLNSRTITEGKVQDTTSTQSKLTNISSGSEIEFDGPASTVELFNNRLGQFSIKVDEAAPPPPTPHPRASPVLTFLSLKGLALFLTVIVTMIWVVCRTLASKSTSASGARGSCPGSSVSQSEDCIAAKDDASTDFAMDNETGQERQLHETPAGALALPHGPSTSLIVRTEQMVVLDSQGALADHLCLAEEAGPSGKSSSAIKTINPLFAPCDGWFNPFDNAMSYDGTLFSENELNKLVDDQLFILEALVGRSCVLENRSTLRQLLRLTNIIPNSTFWTLETVLDHANWQLYGKYIQKLGTRSSRSFFTQAPRGRELEKIAEKLSRSLNAVSVNGYVERALSARRARDSEPANIIHLQLNDPDQDDAAAALLRRIALVKAMAFLDQIASSSSNSPDLKLVLGRPDAFLSDTGDLNRLESWAMRRDVSLEFVPFDLNFVPHAHRQTIDDMTSVGLAEAAE